MSAQLLVVDGFDFSFNEEVVNAFIFDERSSGLSTTHSLLHCMKAVDLIIERQKEYLFVEVKNLALSSYDYGANRPFNHLIEALKYKFRDTFLYRYAEKKLDKPIRYICLIELDSPLLTRIAKELRLQLPVKTKTGRWKQPLAESVLVVDSDRWNRNFHFCRVSKPGNNGRASKSKPKEQDK